MSMYISGLGVLGIFGKGKEALINAINNKITTDKYTDLSIDLKSVKDKELSKQIRRADRFTKMSVYSAADAIADAGIENLNMEKTGIIVATGFGPHNTTFEFLDELITYGDKSVSPIKFSHSVHTAAASYISQLFKIKGPVSTITQFKFPVQYAVQLADCWLNTGLCENILLCCVDEKGNVFNKAIKEEVNISPDNKLNSNNFSKQDKAVPTEGCVSFILTLKKKNFNSYCMINKVNFESNSSEKSNDYIIANADGIPGNQLYYNNLSNTNFHVFTPYYGSILTSTAFDLAIASLLLDNSLKVKGEAFISDTINCIKYSCSEECSRITINR